MFSLIAPVSASASTTDLSQQLGISINSIKERLTILESSQGEEKTNIFTQQHYSLQVDRDYNQIREIEIENNSNEAREYYLKLDRSYDDLAINFIDEGSSAEPTVLLPNERRSVKLGIHTQDARQRQYELPVSAIDAATNLSLGEATVHLEVKIEDLQLRINEISTDKHTLAKTLKITNDGKQVTDVRLMADESLAPYLTFEPVIDNMVLGNHQSVQVTVTPALADISIEQKISGNLLLSGAGQEQAYPTTFDLTGKTKFEFTLADLYAEQFKQQYGEIDPIDYNGTAQLVEPDHLVMEGSSEDESVTYSIGVKPLIDGQSVDNATSYELDGSKLKVNLKSEITGKQYEQLLGMLENDLGAALFKSKSEVHILSVDDAKLVVDITLTFDIEAPKLYNIFSYGYQAQTTFGDLTLLSSALSSSSLSEEQKIAFTVLTVAKVGLDMFNMVPTAAKPATLIAGYILGIIYGQVAESWGIKNDVAGMFYANLFGQACINRKIVMNRFTVPSYMSGQTGDYGYVSSRIYRPDGGGYIPEKIDYDFNGVHVFGKDGVVIEGPLNFPFPADSLKYGQDNILKHTNSHNNSGNYILSTDMNIIVPIQNPDFNIILVGDNEEDARDGLGNYNGITRPKADYAVYPESISVNGEALVAGETYELIVNAHNLGLIGGFSHIEIKDNSDLIYSGYKFIDAQNSRPITLQWTPSAAGNHTITVRLNNGFEHLEMNRNNNQANRTYRVHQADHTAPEIANVAPMGTVSDVKIISADITDQTVVKKVVFYIDGEALPISTVKNSQDRYWVQLKQPLALGSHELKVEATDLFSNKSEYEWTLEVAEKAPAAGLIKDLRLGKTDFYLGANQSISLLDDISVQLPDGNYDSSYNYRDKLLYEAVDTTLISIEQQSGQLKALKEGSTQLRISLYGITKTVSVHVGEEYARNFKLLLPLEEGHPFHMEWIASKQSYGYKQTYYLQPTLDMIKRDDTLEINASFPEDKLRDIDNLRVYIPYRDKLYIEAMDEHDTSAKELRINQPAKIIFPENLQLTGLTVDVVGEDHRSEFTANYSTYSYDHILLPSEYMYRLTIAYQLHGEVYIYQTDEESFVEGDHFLSIEEDFDLVSLETNAQLPLSVQYMNFYNGMHSIFIDQNASRSKIWLKPGNYSLNIGAEDPYFSYSFYKNTEQLTSSKTVSVGKEFSAKLDFDANTIEAGERIRPRLTIKDATGLTLNSIYSKPDYTPVAGYIQLASVDNPQVVHRIQVANWYDPSFVAPSLPGIYEVSFVVPGLTIVEDDSGSGDGDSDPGPGEDNGNGNGSSNGNGEELKGDTDSETEPLDKTRFSLTVSPGNAIVADNLFTLLALKDEAGNTLPTMQIEAEFAEWLKQQPESNHLHFNNSSPDKERLAIRIPVKLIEELLAINPGYRITITTANGSHSLPLELLKPGLEEAGEGTLTISLVEVSLPKDFTRSNPALKVVSKAFRIQSYVESDGKKTAMAPYPKYADSTITANKSINPDYTAAVSFSDDGTIRPVPARFEGPTASIRSFTYSNFVIVEHRSAFEDIPQGFWGKSAMDKLASKLLMKGKSEKKAAPHDVSTRAEATALIVRSLALQPRTDYNGQFQDVKGAEWFANELSAALHAGLITGVTENSFNPAGEITRQDTAVLMARMLRYVGYAPERLTNQTIHADQYRDADAIRSYAKDDVSLLLQAGILSEMNTFNPTAPITRAELAKMLERTLTFLELM